MRRSGPGQASDLTALYDSDTGLYGKAVFEILGDELVEQARRYNPPLSLAVYGTQWPGEPPTDPEQVSETYHYLGLLLVENLRRCDIAAHLGNGLFGVLMPYTAADVAREVSERMCDTIIGSPVILRSGDQIQMIATVGVAVFDKSHHNLQDLLLEAGKAHNRSERGALPPPSHSLPTA